MKKAKIAVDFDGVIYSYKSGYFQDKLPDSPVNGALEFLNSLLDNGYDVCIFSTRTKDESAIKMIKEWLMSFGFEKVEQLEFANTKPLAKIYLDDRAIQFNGIFPSLKEIDNFVPWHGGSSSSVKEYCK